MSEQPATTSRVRAGFCGSPESPIFPILAERFDLWFDQVKAAARREGQAEAWREGRNAGVDDMIAADLGVNRRNIPNPYEEVRDVDQ